MEGASTTSYLNHLAQLPHLLNGKHGHPANVHVHLGFPSSVVLGLSRNVAQQALCVVTHLALCHHLLNKTLLLGEVCLQHIQLLLQLVNREAVLQTIVEPVLEQNQKNVATFAGSLLLLVSTHVVSVTE